MDKLWSRTKIGNMELPHRLAMAPMTRSRAEKGRYTGRIKLPLLCSKSIYGFNY